MKTFLFLLTKTDSPQVSDQLKQNVPDHIKEKAREMARQELQRRLEELDMTASEAKGYGQLLTATQAHMASLLDLLERKSASDFGMNYSNQSPNRPSS